MSNEFQPEINRKTAEARRTRRTFLKTGLLGLPRIVRAAPKKRNVLFIASDDLCTRVGCYGNQVVRTPNIDKLARSGVRFERAYCQYPWCSPSRSSLMTGLAPDTTKVWDLTTHFRKALPDVVTLPQVFQRNGYFTARAGKIYHYGNPGDIGTAGLDDPPSWNETANPAGVDHTKEEDLLTFLAPGQAAAAAAARAKGTRRSLGATIAYHKSEAGDNQHTDYLVADATIQSLEKHRNDPWFFGAGFYKPHVPWIVPSKYFDLYDLNRIDVPPFDPSEMQIAPHWAYTTQQPNMGMNDRQHREAMRAYYAAASFLDAQIGRLLDAVRRLGLAGNTTIVFWADHGWHLGEHGQWQKQMLFDPSVRVPVVFAGAGVRNSNKVCRRTVEHLDLYPTITELCGLADVPSGLHGDSLVPLLNRPDAAWDRPAISQVDRNAQGKHAAGYSIRTERYRYTFWERGAEGEELYDYQTDPRELKNLAADNSAAPLKARLKESLEKIAQARGLARS